MFSCGYGSGDLSFQMCDASETTRQAGCIDIVQAMQVQIACIFQLNIFEQTAVCTNLKAA